MLKSFNMLVSSARGNEREANAEMRYLLNELGDHNVTTGFTTVSGLTVANTSLDPVDAVQKLRPVLAKKPWQFRYVLKIKPVMRVTPADPDAVSEAVGELSPMITPEETFRISIQKRHSELESRELIDMAAKRVPRKVDLENPSKIILIEVLGELACVSIIKEEDILSVEPEKRLFTRSQEEPIARRQDA